MRKIILMTIVKLARTTTIPTVRKSIKVTLDLLTYLEIDQSDTNSYH